MRLTMQLDPAMVKEALDQYVQDLFTGDVEVVECRYLPGDETFQVVVRDLPGDEIEEPEDDPEIEVPPGDLPPEYGMGREGDDDTIPPLPEADEV
jgi:hypothetical protein